MSDEEKQLGWMQRLHRALGPIAGGLVLDFVDLATLGPIGLIAGPFLGFAAAMWVCSVYNFSTSKKIWLSLLAGLYCTIPMTAPFPLATLTMALCRFFENSSPTSKTSSRVQASPNRRKTVSSKTVD